MTSCNGGSFDMFYTSTVDVQVYEMKDSLFKMYGPIGAQALKHTHTGTHQILLFN